MTASQSADKAWKEYRNAVRGLFGLSEKGPESAERGKREVATEQFDEKSAGLVVCSEELRLALSAAMEKETAERRELAALKLMSAAAYDLSIACDVIEADDDGTGGDVEREVSGSIIVPSELMEILNAPLEPGMAGLYVPDRRAHPGDPVSAKSELEDAVSEYLQDIPNDAATLSQTAFSGIVAAGRDEWKDLACFAADEILKMVPDNLSLFIRNAARLIVEAVKKIREAVGKGFEDHIWEQISGWLDDIRQSAARKLLDGLYETKRIEEDMAELLASPPQGTDARPYNRAVRKLDALSARYEKATTVLGLTMRILDFAKAPLMNLPPWGPTVVYGAYAGILGYAVFNGGDYLDWYRLEEYQWLDRVEGLRTVLNDSLEPLKK